MLHRDVLHADLILVFVVFLWLCFHHQSSDWGASLAIQTQAYIQVYDTGVASLGALFLSVYQTASDKVCEQNTPKAVLARAG